jgi:hypothetical protein
LREAGRTIDEIMAHLATMGLDSETMPSRSGVGRKVQSIDRMLDTVRSSRGMAEALVERLGEAKEGRQARANIELMQALVMQVLATAASGDGEMSLTAKEASMLAKTLADLARAQKTDIDNTVRQKKLVAEEIATDLEALEAASAGVAPVTTEQMIARIRALYAGEG